jgi:hypothetical protein
MRQYESFNMKQVIFAEMIPKQKKLLEDQIMSPVDEPALSFFETDVYFESNMEWLWHSYKLLPSIVKIMEGRDGGSICPTLLVEIE